MLNLEELRQFCNLEYEEAKDADLVDPELFVDELPQPYRNVDFLLNEIICNAFDIFVERCNKRKDESNRPSVKSLRCNSYIFGYGFPSTIITDNSTRLFVGTQDGLITLRNNIFSSRLGIPDKRLQEVKSTKVVNLAEDLWIISILDCLGKPWLYGTSQCQAFMLWTPKDEDSNSDHANSLVVSEDGSFMGISWSGTEIIHLEALSWYRQNATNRAQSIISVKMAKIVSVILRTKRGGGNRLPCVEVYSLPKENWIRELNGFKRKDSSKQEDQSSDQQNSEQRGQEQKADDSSNSAQPNGSQASDSVPPLPGDPSQFSKPGVIMKIPLTNPGNKSSNLTLGSALKSVEGECQLVGSGMGHLLTPSFCDSYQAKMDERYHHYLRFLQRENDKVEKVTPMITFLGPVRKGGASNGIEPSDVQPAMIAITRPNFNQLFGYSLTKTGKDNVKKPDLVIPNCTNIVNVAVSRCTTLLAVVTEAGHIVIWNRQLAKPLKIELVLGDKLPRFFKFASIEGQISIEERLLLGISHGDQQFLQVHCSYFECSSPSPVNDSSCFEMDEVLDVVLCPRWPKVVAGMRQSKRITLFDLTSGDAVAHVCAPDGLELCFDVPSPICFLTSEILVKAVRRNIKEDLEDDQIQGGILVFSMEGLECLLMKTSPFQSPGITSPEHRNVPLNRDWKQEFLARYQNKDERAKGIRRRWTQFKHELQCA